MAERKRRATADRVAKTSTVARYQHLPPLPSWTALRGRLAELNRNQDGPDEVWLYCAGAGWPDAEWRVDGNCLDWPHAIYQEPVPGDGKPFDATAAARRLLSHARLEGFR